MQQNYQIHSPPLQYLHRIEVHNSRNLLHFSGERENLCQVGQQRFGYRTDNFLSLLPYQPKEPCGRRPLIYFCLLIAMTTLGLIWQCGYQKSVINIRVKLMSTEDPAWTRRKARGIRVHYTYRLVSVSSSSVPYELSLSWDRMGFALLGVSNPRCAVHGNNGCLFDRVGTMLFHHPWLAIHSCIHLFAPLFMLLSHKHRTKPEVLIMEYKAPGYFSRLISYHCNLSLASRLLFICIKHPRSSGLCTCWGDSSAPCVPPCPADQPGLAYMVPQQVSKREKLIGLSRPRLGTGTGPHSVDQSRSRGKSRFRG